MIDRDKNVFLIILYNKILNITLANSMTSNKKNYNKIITKFDNE